MSSFTVKEVNLDVGFITVDVVLPGGGSMMEMTFDIRSVVPYSEANELEIANGLRQLVNNRLAQLFPPPPPAPPKALEMIGKTYEV